MKSLYLAAFTLVFAVGCNEEKEDTGPFDNDGDGYNAAVDCDDQ